METKKIIDKKAGYWKNKSKIEEAIKCLEKENIVNSQNGKIFPVKK